MPPIEASAGWVTILILAIWVVSAYFEGKRKRQLKSMRRQALQRQKQPSSEQHPKTVPAQRVISERIQSPPRVLKSQPVQNQKALDEAEKIARQAKRKTLSQGTDLQVRTQDILRSLGEAPAMEMEDQDDVLHALEIENQRLKEQIQSFERLAREQLKEKQRQKAREQTSPAREYEMPKTLPSDVSSLLAIPKNLVSAIVLREILSKPKSLR